MDAAARVRGLAFSCVVLLVAADATGAGKQRRLWEKLPDDAVLAAHADVIALRSGGMDLEAWTARLLSEPPEDVRAGLASAGLRLDRDVDEIAFAVAPGRGSDRSFVVLVHGRFDRGRVREAAVAQGGLPVALPVAGTQGGRRGKGVEVTFVDAIQLPTSRMAYLSFAGDDVLAVGTRDLTERLHGRSSPPAAALVGVAAARPSVAWLHSSLPSILLKDGAAAVAFQGVRELTAWAAVADGLDVRFVARAADGPAAEQLAAVLRLSALLQREPGTSWAQVLEAAASGDEVTGRVRVPSTPPAGS